MFVTLRWQYCVLKSLNYWHLATYRERVRFLCFACWLRSGFSHFINIDSLSFTWYLVAAESRIWQQSGVQDVRRQDSELCRCLQTFEDLSESKCSRTRAKKCRLPSFTKITSMHYNLHSKIYHAYACVATQRQHLSSSSSSLPKIEIKAGFKKRGSNEPLKLPKIERSIAAIAHAQSSLFEVIGHFDSFHISHSWMHKLNDTAALVQLLGLKGTSLWRADNWGMPGTRKIDPLVVLLLSRRNSIGLRSREGAWLRM